MAGDTWAWVKALDLYQFERDWLIAGFAWLECYHHPEALLRRCIVGCLSFYLVRCTHERLHSGAGGPPDRGEQEYITARVLAAMTKAPRCSMESATADVYTYSRAYAVRLVEVPADAVVIAPPPIKQKTDEPPHIGVFITKQARRDFWNEVYGDRKVKDHVPLDAPISKDSEGSAAVGDLYGACDADWLAVQERLQELRRQEAEVARALLQGYSQTEIAERLKVTKGRISQIVKELRGDLKP